MELQRVLAAVVFVLLEHILLLQGQPTAPRALKGLTRPQAPPLVLHVIKENILQPVHLRVQAVQLVNTA